CFSHILVKNQPMEDQYRTIASPALYDQRQLLTLTDFVVVAITPAPEGRNVYSNEEIISPSSVRSDICQQRMSRLWGEIRNQTRPGLVYLLHRSGDGAKIFFSERTVKFLEGFSSCVLLYRIN